MANGNSTFVPSASARRVLVELRHGPSTVEDLAKRMDLTPNAVRNQLNKLRAANYVVGSASRPGTSKPSVLYSITVEGEAQFSTIYLPVLSQFLRVAEGRCKGAQLGKLMTDTGRSLAKRYPKPSGDLKARAIAAAKLLETFGGLPEVHANGSVVIRSAGCPLSALTSENAAACRVLEGFISEITGNRAKVCCIREPEPRCCFELRK